MIPISIPGSTTEKLRPISRVTLGYYSEFFRRSNDYHAWYIGDFGMQATPDPRVPSNVVRGSDRVLKAMLEFRQQHGMRT